MNILPKKRWHVRNRDNKERVRRDEENARLEQKREEERIDIAEQEARLSLLRSKFSALPSSSQALDHSRHINLFEEEERNGHSLGGVCNKDYVEEKKLEKEAFEKKIGLLTYVGQSAIESREKKEQLWYLEKREETEKLKKSADDLAKEKLDPLNIVHKHLHYKKHKSSEKKKKKTKERSPSPPKSKRKSLEQLREERLKREKKEKQREHELLYGKKGEANPVESDPNRYNNQFHPHLAKKRYKPY